MNQYGFFRVYSPQKGSKRDKLAVEINAIFIRDNLKNDWYDLQKKLDKKALKIVFTSDGVINFASYDASTLWPINSYIAVIDEKLIPKNFSVPIVDQSWRYLAGDIVPRVYTKEEQQKKAARDKNQLLESASKIIAPLQDAIDLDICSDEEREKLTTWKKYRVLLSRVETSKAPNIEWPEAPHNVA